MDLFSSGDVVAISNLPFRTFMEWNDKNIVASCAPVRGHGNHRRFTLMQAVGIVHGVRLRQEAEAPLSYVARVIAYIGDMPEAELHGHFAKGEKYLFPGGQMRLTGPWEGMEGETYNVERAYNAVRAYGDRRKRRAERRPTVSAR